MVPILIKRCTQPLRIPMHVYEIRPHREQRGVDLIFIVMNRLCRARALNETVSFCAVHSKPATIHGNSNYFNSLGTNRADGFHVMIYGH